MQNKAYDLHMKMVFVGQSGVGKTNLITRITSDEFHQQHLATIGVQFKQKIYEVDGLKINCQMWDTAGQQRYRSMSPVYYRGAGAILLCYDLSSIDSLQGLEKWLDEVTQNTKQNTQTFVIGCKSDLQNMVPTDIIEQMIGERGWKHFITSSKTGDGVKEAFHAIVTSWTRKVVKQMIAGKSADNQMKQKPLKPQDMKDGGRKPFKTTCC